MRLLDHGLSVATAEVFLLLLACVPILLRARGRGGGGSNGVGRGGCSVKRGVALVCIVYQLWD